MTNLILFDGECNFCDHSVQFIMKKDKRELYQFASIQSDAGREICRKLNVSTDIDSIILVEGYKCYYKSSAVLKVLKNLSGVWKLFYCWIILPKIFRDYVYDTVARNRYKWFGKKDSCMLPSPEMRKRFL